MMNILNFYEAGKARSGSALIPFFDSTKITLAISTRYGISVIDKGDGSFYNYSNPHFLDYSTGASDRVNRITINYSTAYTGNISINFKQGLKDVYSISTYLFRDSATDTKLNILNIESFFSQFPNLYSVRLLEHCYLSNEKSVFKGDLSRFPDSVERIYISCIEVQNAATDLILNFSNYNNSSKLKYFNFSGDRAGLPNSNMKVIGDISKIPQPCAYFYLLKVAAGSAITYTAGKAWASSFDTLSIPLPLSHTELDNLLIDMNNSITTKIGVGVIALGGYRSATSDAAVASLIAKGFTVNVMRLTRTLNLPLSANLLDTSGYANNAVMVGVESHSNSGLITGTGKYAHSPSHISLQIGTGSIGFGCEVKFNSAPSVVKGIIGKSIAAGTDGRYSIYVTGGNITALTDIDATNIINQTPITPYLDGNFHKIEVFCNRITGVQYLWIDGVLINTTTFTTNSTNFTNSARFAIGSYNDATGIAMLANSELDGIIRNVYFDKVI